MVFFVHGPRASALLVVTTTRTRNRFTPLVWWYCQDAPRRSENKTLNLSEAMGTGLNPRPCNAAGGAVGYPSGQRGQTVNLLAYAFAGSNPAPTTTSKPLTKQCVDKPLQEFYGGRIILHGDS